jgi:photosystem II cytochrome c550
MGRSLGPRICPPIPLNPMLHRFLRAPMVDDRSAPTRTVPLALGLSRLIVLSLMVLCAIGSFSPAALAAPDPYVAQFLKVLPGATATVALDSAGQTKTFDYDQLLVGKELFGQNCLSCHVGGTSLGNPEVSLSMANLQAATPPRDTLDALVSYIRHPMAYDGSDENFACREVSPDWIPQAQVEQIAAFILRAAEKAPGWGSSKF